MAECNCATAFQMKGLGTNSNQKIVTVSHAGEFVIGSNQNTNITVIIFLDIMRICLDLSILHHLEFPNTIINNS